MPKVPLFCSVASIAIFLSKSESSINPEISDLSANPFSLPLH